MTPLFYSKKFLFSKIGPKLSEKSRFKKGRFFGKEGGYKELG
jgi:hypothetical protein